MENTTNIRMELIAAREANDQASKLRELAAELEAEGKKTQQSYVRRDVERDLLQLSHEILNIVHRGNYGDLPDEIKAYLRRKNGAKL